MVKNRLAKLEKAVGVLDGGACRICRGGAYPFVVNRWIKAGGHRDEPEASEVYDGQGNCRACGCACSDAVILVLLKRSTVPAGERTSSR